MSENMTLFVLHVGAIVAICLMMGCASLSQWNPPQHTMTPLGSEYTFK